jgi:DNA polymerase III subunit delta'
MRFTDVIGQQALTRHLARQVQEERAPHAMLLLGPPGAGGLALAFAYAQYLLCEDRQDTDSCGVCVACTKAARLLHPDLHCTYPVVTRKSGEKPVSNDFIKEWRSTMVPNPYLSQYDWLRSIGAENQQGNITARECREIINRLGMKAFEGRCKVQIIWMAEALGNEGNILLKLIEEPPDDTYLILVAEDEELILKTILSRCQVMRLQGIRDEDMVQALMARHEVPEQEAWKMAHLADGNYHAAVQLLGSPAAELQNRFVVWMRALVKGQISVLADWGESMAPLGREQQKAFIRYALHCFREALRMQHLPGMPPRLTDDQLNVAMYIAEHVQLPGMDAIVARLENMHYAIQRNANPKVQFLHLSLEMMDLLKNRVPARVERVRG